LETTKPFLSRSRSIGTLFRTGAFNRPKNVLSTCQLITAIIKIINRKHIHSKKLYIIDGPAKEVDRIFLLLAGLLLFTLESPKEGLQKLEHESVTICSAVLLKFIYDYEKGESLLADKDKMVIMLNFRKY
jgi:hypothetical protein